MTAETSGARIIADVKCYHCGHVSGQIYGVRHQPLRVSNFVPRPGYSGPEVRPGMRLRCERCRGPVFLEDASNGQPMMRRRAGPRPAASQDAA
jgi:hypothetical protein